MKQFGPKYVYGNMNKKKMVSLSERQAVHIIENWWSRYVSLRRQRENEDPFPPHFTILFESIRSYTPKEWEDEHYIPLHLYNALRELLDTELDYFSYGCSDEDDVIWSDTCKTNDYKHTLIECMDNGDHVTCDMCARFISVNSKSFTCCEGCDFDICAGCFAHQHELPFRHLCIST